MIKNSSTASCVAAFLTFGLIFSVGFEENPVSSLPSIVVIFVISPESLVDFKSAPLSEELILTNSVVINELSIEPEIDWLLRVRIVVVVNSTKRL